MFFTSELGKGFIISDEEEVPDKCTIAHVPFSLSAQTYLKTTKFDIYDILPGEQNL